MLWEHHYLFVIFSKFIPEERPNDHFVLKFPLQFQQRLLGLDLTTRCENYLMQLKFQVYVLNLQHPKQIEFYNKHKDVQWILPYWIGT